MLALLVPGVNMGGGQAEAPGTLVGQLPLVGVGQ